MNMQKIHLPSLDDLKTQAKRLRADLSASSTPVTHSAALELVAHQLGFKDWNTLHAAVGNTQRTGPVAMGEIVSGFYLGQEFLGEVIGIRSFAGHGKFRITLDLEEPVDVVKFDSFSSFRKRINCTIDCTGKTVEKTSDGQPQLVLAY